MKIKFDNFELNVETPSKLSQNKKYIFFLHGFTCSSLDWSDVIDDIVKNFNPILIDLIGHGKSDSPENLDYYRVESQIEQIKKIISHFTDEKIILCGYSMGGRLALSFANKYPENLSGLILESSTYGIKNNSEREKRIKRDNSICEYIKSHSIEEFVNLWMNKDIFNSLKKLPEEKYNSIIKSKLENNKIGLVNSLLGFGTGIMPSLFDELKKIKIPTLLITGELDKKFTTTNKEMVNEFPSANHFIIKHTGHSAHLENSTEFINRINQFLSDLK